jgi:predicted phosphodiesterase
MLKVAVLSDIHAHSRAHLEKDETEPSYVEIGATDSPSTNPFAGLNALIEQEEITVDVLASGGDMGDKAHPEAITYAWNKILALQKSLEAPVLLPATGNHDMDSRAINGYDARGTLQGLIDYPFSDLALNNEYWANNVVVQEHEGFRSVLLNSAAYHGYKDEWEHGRASARTREYLKSRLAATSDRGINLLLTHHQLYNLDSIDLKAHSEMKEASALLNELGSGDFGSWFMIHGHRHWPALSQAAGSRSAPYVFSAGSFSAVLYPEIQNRARNQFYVLELADTQPGYPIRGRFRAWDWIADSGWLPAQDRSGLPHAGGFGSAKNGVELAADISKLHDSKGGNPLAWDVVEAEIPDVYYTMPKDLKVLRRCLLDSHTLTVLQDELGYPVQVGRM